MFGQLSDRIGRKLPILAPFIGEALSCIVMIFNSIYIESSLGFMLLASVCYGCGGSLYSILMTTVAYVTDISPNESKTMRVSLLYACSSLASFIVLTFSGVLLDHTSFELVFTLCFCIYVIGALYVIIFLKNVKASSRNDDVSEDTKKAESDDVTCCQEFLQSVKEICLVVVRPRKYNRRKHILLLAVVIVTELLGTSDTTTTITLLILQNL